MEHPPEYCPVFVAAELVADRWTALILREFIVGARTFSEIQRGIPHVSRTILSQRLRQLVANGLVERTAAEGERPGYALTPAGQDLEPIILAMGAWAVRWLYFGEPADEQLDNAHLLWRFRQFVRTDRVPPGRTVIEFVLTCVDGRVERLWLVIEPSEVQACVKHPGFDIDLEVRASSAELHRIWMGWTSVADAIRRGRLELAGPPRLTRAFPQWFAYSPFAPQVRSLAKALPAS